MSKEISRRQFLKGVGALVAAASIGLALRGEYSGADDIAVDSGLSLKDKSKGEINERGRILMVDLSEGTLGARLLAENQGGRDCFEKPCRVYTRRRKARRFLSCLEASTIFN